MRLRRNVELISHNASGVSSLRIRYRQESVSPRANLLPISAPALLPDGDEQRRRLIDGRKAFEERPSPTVVQRPGARGGGGGGCGPAGPRRDGRCRTGQGRSLAVTRCYINVLLKTDGKVCFAVNESAEPEPRR